MKPMQMFSLAALGSCVAALAAGVFAAPPAVPVLVSPADQAKDVIVSPVLTAGVSDPDSSPLTVTWFARAVPPGPGDEDFTVIALPDTQFYSQTYPQTFIAQTEWILAEREARNIVAVMHEGDIVQTASKLNEWTNANAAISVLDRDPTLPYGLTVGNHDQTPNGNPFGTQNFNTYFPASRYEGVAPWYGGHYGVDNDNHYIFFSASGLDFIAIFLEYDTAANPAVLNWADALLKQHADRRAIVVSHYIIGTGNPASFGAQGQQIYNGLKDNPNLFMMLCGHISGEGRRTDVFDGNTVHTLLADYQSRPNGGDGWLRIYEFSPLSNIIRVLTYSVTLQQYETDASSQFTLPYAMTSGGAPFEVIGQKAAPPGAVKLVAPLLEPKTTYEWYVTVSDGVDTVASQTRRFTTGCIGDVNADGDVDQMDLNVLLAAFGCNLGPSLCVADVNGDGATDQADLNLVLVGFTNCN